MESTAILVYVPGDFQDPIAKHSFLNATKDLAKMEEHVKTFPWMEAITDVIVLMDGLEVIVSRL
jgi:hypothetical protein